MQTQELQSGFALEILNYKPNQELKTLRELLLRFGVIFIRDIELDFCELESLARAFGELQDISGKPSSTSKPTDNKYIRTMEYDGQPVDFPAGWFWHSEMSYSESRPSGGLLYMTKIPQSGGDTLFADQRAAYSKLSPGMKKYIQNLTCVHEVGWWFKNKPEKGTVQNVVETHPETGERYLNVCDVFTTRINGLPFDEAKYLLSFLQNHASNDVWTHRHTWTENCLAIWDDRLVQHKAIHNFNSERVGHRIQLI